MLKKLKPKSEFSKNSLSLISGTMLSQAIPAALSPILTRIYTPEDFGVFALFMSVALIFILISTLKYENAIIIPKSDKEAINLVSLIFLISFSMSILSLIFIFFFKDSLGVLLGISDIVNWFYAIPVSIIFVGFYNALNMWSIRKKRFKRISLNLIISSATNSSSSIGLGLLGFGSLGLLYSALISQLFSLIHLFKKTLENDKYLFKYVSEKNMKKMAIRYKKMPLFIMSNTLIDMIRISSLNFLVIHFFSISLLGQMTLAFRIIRTPMTIIGSSIIQVFLQKLSVTDKENVYPLLKKYLFRFILVSMPAYIFFYIYSPVIFPFLFGSQWVMAGEIGSILSMWMFFHVLTISSGHLFLLHKREEVLLFFSIIYLIIPFIIFFSFYHLDFLEVFSIMAYTMVIINCIFVLYSLYFARSLKV